MFFAHSEDKRGVKECLIQHLMEVAHLTKEFAFIWGSGQEGEVTGILHDLGKYSELFQKVLTGDAIHVDHATPGALAVLKKYREAGMAAALAIQGHHDGLQKGYHKDLQSSVMMKGEVSASGKRYSSRDINLLLERFKANGGDLPNSIESRFIEDYKDGNYISAMVYVRMLFSALVDADFLATEAHFNRTGDVLAYRQPGLKLCAKKALGKVLTYKEDLEKTVRADNRIKSIRDDLFNICIKQSEKPRGIYTITAPTGSGKTISVLAFALKHAYAHKLRRVIIVLPFLNIIEQTAKTFRDIFKDFKNNHFILEDHSLVEWPEDSPLKFLAENWDAPIIITTTVKFFEGLFSNRPSTCRRLHNIADSVVVFDEAQSMPPSLVIPTLASLSELKDRFGCTVVFSTATQPAFESLNDHVKEYCIGGWSPEEIVPKELRLFQRAQRVEVVWHKERFTWNELAEEVIKHKRSLTIVNLRRHAKELYSCVREASKARGISDDSIFHLSTNMCPLHRMDTLKVVKSKVGKCEPCILISTQCVEAGVDLDFPEVWRAMGPLESIVQAAGRCNRNGIKSKGMVHVFRPSIDEEAYPGPEYRMGAAQVQLMLEKYDIELDNPDVIREYYRNFFEGARLHEKNIKLKEAVNRLDFAEVSKLYHWIPNIGINILVPYEPAIDLFNMICQEVRSGKINKHWERAAAPISVGMILNKNSPIRDFLEPVTDKKGQETGWYILLAKDAYSKDVGLDISHIEPEEYYLA